MQNILVLGAGRSATVLIKYLLKEAPKENWFITVGDASFELAAEKVGANSNGKAIPFDIFDEDRRKKEFGRADVVISYLPPNLHPLVAKECLKVNTHFVCASYVSEEMEALHDEAKEKGLIFLNEMGLDPGIDHMDAKRLIDKVIEKGGEPVSFKSYCGGLPAPESDNNPWGYKFTWSPINVVLAGQPFARYIKDSFVKIVPYNRLFQDTEEIEIEGVGKYEAYPNRDSLHYKDLYGLNDIKDFYRATLRKPGFCQAWDALVRIGITDNSYPVCYSNKITYKEWLRRYLPELAHKSIEEVIARFINRPEDDETVKKIVWLDIANDNRVGMKEAPSAKILLKQLEKKWVFEENDNDVVLMQSELKYNHSGKEKTILSSMIFKGKGKSNTAMSITAGLPAGIGAKLILQDKIKERGVIIPVTLDIYEPALAELKENGIGFTEREVRS